MFVFSLRSVPVLQSKLSDNTITQNMMRDIYSTVTFIYSLLYLTTATSVYYVTPYDQSDINSDCPIDHECHTLQYYLLNSSKYFASNTQLHFLQGIFYINADIVIDSLHNFSLLGSSVNNTLIECSTPSLIAIINCTNTVIKNITTGSQCGASKNSYFNIVKYQSSYLRKYNMDIFNIPNKDVVTVYLLNSYSTVIHSVSIKRHGMLIINGLGNTTLVDVVQYHENLEIFYIAIYKDSSIAQSNDSSVLHIFNFKYYDDEVPKINARTPWYIIMIEFWQEYHNTGIIIENTTFQFLNRIQLIVVRFIYCNRMNHIVKKFVTIKSCQFLNNSGVPQIDGGMISVTFPICHMALDDAVFNRSLFNTVIVTNMNTVQIVNSSFINNTAFDASSIIIELDLMLSYPNISRFVILHGIFANNYNFSLLKVDKSIMANLQQLILDHRKYFFCNITIEDTQFILPGSGEDVTPIYSNNSNLQLNGPLVFTNFKNQKNNIIVAKYSNVTIHGCIKFLNINANSLLFHTELNIIQLKESVVVNISNSTFSAEIFHTNYTTQLDGIPLILTPYPWCFFQYISDYGNLDQNFTLGTQLNFSIIIYKTVARSLTNFHITHCRWQPNSAFNTTSPLFVNQRFISDYDKWNDIINIQTQRRVCSCSHRNNINCTINIFGPVYPGQNAIFSLALMDPEQNITEIVPISLETIKYSPLQCEIPIAPTQQNVNSYECSNVSYTLLSHANDMCELLLKQDIATVNGVKVSYSNFYVKLLPCPPGFLFTQMRCQCDPVLTLNGYVKDCDINDQTVLRCPNSWIFYSESLHTYQLSKNCPFDYCYPQSSKLNLNNPELQCQFSRSGSLCGQCQQGLSTIFGSNKCQQCSDVYLLLIIPIAISGIVLVIIMFVLNLTVSEGTINPFILYFNILNIHNIPLFPSHSLVKPLHVIISFANLNLGIETCFYNGMDDYTKAWLQFSFPIYLIMIIVSIIIASRYSIVLQRLTLHKKVPVLATILLLSYTKILQTTTNVLFMYSTITHYPSNVSSVVWSIDANVPLFGIRHSILFVFSLLIFLSLILYTCLLLFGRYCRSFKFRVIVYINPLLNACNKPYKDNCCYWLGYELIIRCVLFGTLLAVNNSTISLVIGNSFLSMVQFNFQHPFQNHVNNISQMVLNLNLLILYSTSLMLSVDQSMHVVVVNTMVGFGVVQFILMTMINRFSSKYFKVNMIGYLRQKLFRKKQSDDITDVLLARQDYEYVS